MNKKGLVITAPIIVKVVCMIMFSFSFFVGVQVLDSFTPTLMNIAGVISSCLLIGWCLLLCDDAFRIIELNGYSLIERSILRTRCIDLSEPFKIIKARTNWIKNFVQDEMIVVIGKKRIDINIGNCRHKIHDPLIVELYKLHQNHIFVDEKE